MLGKFLFSMLRVSGVNTVLDVEFGAGFVGGVYVGAITV